MIRKYCSVYTNKSAAVYRRLTNEFCVKFYIDDIYQKNEDIYFFDYEESLKFEKQYANT